MEDFGTVLECMDGRPQRRVADYLMTSFGIRYVDTITTAGTVKHLASDTDQTAILLANLAISVDKHGSRHIAVVAHADCSGNPVPAKTQRDQIVRSTERIRHMYPDAEVVGLWLNEHWIVEKVARV